MVKGRRAITPAPREVVLPTVRAVPVQAQAHRFTVLTHGTVAPRVDIQMSAEVGGRIVQVAPSFASGGFFEAGEVLVALDPRDYELAVARARAALAEAQVRLQREEAEAKVARQEWQTLGDGEANPLLLREPQLAEARAVVASAEASLAQAELDLARCQIRAPFDGRVWTKQADIGQFVARGELLARLYSVDAAEVRLPITLDDLSYLDLPMEYRGETRANAGPRVTLRARFGQQVHAWEGTIVRTEGEIDPRTRMVTVVARVADPYQRGPDAARPPLAVGLFVNAEIEGRAEERVFLVPRASLRGDNQLLVVDAEERLRFRNVTVLRREQEHVIIGAGLQDGDLVSLSGLEAPVDGMRVRLGEPVNQLARTEGKENR
jgi:membrane fusion protein, multidrug efflux system